MLLVCSSMFHKQNLILTNTQQQKIASTIISGGKTDVKLGLKKNSGHVTQMSLTYKINDINNNLHKKKSK